MAWEYDVFVSYVSRGDEGRWVREVLIPPLAEELTNVHARELTIWHDRDIEGGDLWPERLRQVLDRSRLMIGVFSPSYFRSRWCTWELATMLARHAGDDHTAILPVIYRDGEVFPAEAKVIQQVADLKDMAFLDLPFRTSPKVAELPLRIEGLAREIGRRVDRVPEPVKPMRHCGVD